MKYVIAVHPDVFKWCREIAGFTIEETANILNLDASELEKMENGKEPINLYSTDVNKLARKFDIIPECFFLPSVPDEDWSNKLVYYSRRLPQSKAKKEFLRLLRRVQWLEELFEYDNAVEILKHRPDFGLKDIERHDIVIKEMDHVVILDELGDKHENDSQN